jgi:succinoglycan biosynthesis transport protein ExoP
VSLFFDPTKKLAAAQATDTASVTVASSQEKLEKTLQLQQIPEEEVHLHPVSRIVLHTDPLSPGADRFRYLRMCLRELWNAGKLKSLLITSALPQDGKSTIALNLATALAEGGKRSVLLVEADLHNPTLTKELGLEAKFGLTDCLERNLNPLSAIRRLSPLNWYLLPAGEPVSHPTELLQSEASAALVQKLTSLFDWVLIDSPPVIPVTDALSLARQTNATLLVARQGRTPREAVEKTIALIGKQRVLGIILNGVDGLDKLYSGYYGYYGYDGRAAQKLPGVRQRGAGVVRQSIRSKHSIIDSYEDR